MNHHSPIIPDSVANIDLEQALLGAVLLNNAALEYVPFLEPEHFAEPIHTRIFASIRSKAEAGRLADFKTLSTEFRAETVNEVSGAVYLARLAASATTVVNASEYARGILENYARRSGADGCFAFADRLLSIKPGETITDIAGELADLGQSLISLAPRGRVATSIASHAESFLSELMDPDKAAKATIPLPLPEIGSVLQTDGWELGNLYGLLASSGEGKTSLVLQIMRAAAEAGHPTLLLSFDQTGRQVTRQMVSQATGISIGAMSRKGAINTYEAKLIMQETEVVRRLPIDVDTLRQEKVGRICAVARNFAKRYAKLRRPDGSSYGAPLIILDHNRKVTPEDPKAHEGRIAGAVNGAGKSLAEELGAAVIFLNQRNGNGFRRDVPRPIAMDLFGGEQAKEDYDAILYLYRAEKWRDEKLKVARNPKEEDEIRARFRIGGKDPDGKAEIGAIKVRYGQDNITETLNWEGRFTRYSSARDLPPELFA